MSVGPEVTLKVAGKMLPHLWRSVKDVALKLPEEIVKVKVEVMGSEVKAFSGAARAVVIATFVRIRENLVS
jgi:hypothetical protein